MYYIDDINFTKYGTFEVGNFKSLSKYAAWQEAKKLNLDFSSIKLNFDDDYISTFKWNIEPEEDISSMYKRRAEQLRNDYDYVVLFYSGGSDSHVILDTFVNNNIKIDEIITIGNTEYLPKTAKINQEVFNFAIPYINSLDLKKLGTKFSYFEHGQLMLDQYGNDHHFNNFLYVSNGPLSSWSIALRSSLFKLKMTEHVKLAEKGKKILYIWGLDKPNIFPINGNYCFRYCDSTPDFGSKAYNNRILIGGPLSNFYDEAFFVSREFPEMTIKQCHLIIKEMKKMKLNDYRLCSVEEVANTGPFVEHHLGIGNVAHGKWLKKKELEKMIYPGAPIDSFGDDKVRGSVLFTARDLWFWRSNHPNRHRVVEKYKQIFREDDGYWKYAKDGSIINSNTVFGKPYIIDSI